MKVGGSMAERGVVITWLLERRELFCYQSATQKYCADTSFTQGGGAVGGTIIKVGGVIAALSGVSLKMNYNLIDVSRNLLAIKCGQVTTQPSST